MRSLKALPLFLIAPLAGIPGHAGEFEAIHTGRERREATGGKHGLFG